MELYDILTRLRVFSCEQYFHHARYVSVKDQISVWKRTSTEISMACLRRDRIFNNVIDRSVLLDVRPKSGTKGPSFLKWSYSCDASHPYLS